MKTTLKKRISLFGLATMVLLASCSKNDPASSTDPYGNPPVVNPPAGNSSLQLGSNTKFGNILTDGNGKTLYFFAIDANGSSGCTGGCELAWPVYYAGNETAPAGLVASDIATITRADGKKQTTYKGWPLYYYSGDSNKADVNGDGSGGTWFVAKPDYSVMLANNQLVGKDTKNYLANSQEGTGITQYLTDAAGRTLYAYAPDTFNLNTFTKADLSNNPIWPIYESDVLNVPSVLKKEMMFQITSAGKKQLTYKGHPLYYYSSDVKRGDTKGVSVPTPGVWPVLTLTTAALTQ
ncbi:hypothetical protein [Pedobacter nutrimenti]|uniref:Secreted repeat protein with Y-X4-D motif n=1 Tax=Pedobacter nutrimenti TaxID=1241337 RepID=A0A318UJA0_9SPHI|nr:hypothetical protein [Pedobacter nutrimenti]PYF75188.1 secreted repeat protein with Y-X4-D motif [Pedobacter nutrimenti]